MTHRPVGSGVSFSTSTSSAKSAAFIGKSQALRLFATDSNAFVAIGTEPTATVNDYACLLYTSPSPRDVEESRMPSSA